MRAILVRGVLIMEIQLPNRDKLILDESISIDEKLKIVKDLVEELDSISILDLSNSGTSLFLDSLSNYLVWHKEPEDKGTEDKEILSIKKMEKMKKFKKTSKTINFSDLNSKDSERLFGEYGSSER